MLHFRDEARHSVPVHLEEVKVYLTQAVPWAWSPFMSQDLSGIRSDSSDHISTVFCSRHSGFLPDDSIDSKATPFNPVMRE